MSKRLFVAIDVPLKLTRKLAALPKEHVPKDVRSDVLAGINWVPEANMHITVQFLGWVDEKDFLNIQKDVEKVARNTESFGLKFQKIIYAPPKAQKRMIWAMFGESPQYNALVANINREMKKYIHPRLWDKNVMRKERIPHITLARFKDPQIAKKYPLPDISIKEESFEVETIHLYESKLSKHGPQYTKLSSFRMLNNI